MGSVTKAPKLADLALVPEPLSQASPSRPLCQECGLHRYCKTPFMQPFVPKGWTRQLLIIGEAPGEHEDRKSRRPFTGPAGKVLSRCLRRAGYGPLDVAFVNACRCRPRGNATPSMRQLRACRPFLLRVLERLRPHVVVAAGSTALRAVTNDGRESNVTAARGRVLLVPGLDRAGDVPRVWATYHPAAVLHGATHLERRIVDDLERAGWPELKWPEIAGPCNPLAMLAIDTEYVPETGELLTVGVADIEHALAWDKELKAGYPRKEQIAHLLAFARWLAGHNLAVDIDQLVKLGIAKPEWVDGSKTLDSLLLARLEDENIGKGAYRLERQLLARHNVRPWKSETEELGPDASKWPPEKRIERCRLDAWASAVLVRDLHAAAPASLVEFTHRIAMTVHRIGLAGAVVDLKTLNEIEETLRLDMARARDLVQREAFKAGMTEFSPTNDGHLRELLFERLGLPVVEFTNKERLPKVDKATLKQLSTESGVPKLILTFNKAEKLVSTYVEGVKRALQPFDEGRGWLPVRINPLGARTGRRSSGGRDEDSDEEREGSPNMQNWPSCKKDCPPDCRRHPKKMIVSRFAGGFIGNFDYKSLEPFILAWVAGDERLYEAFAKQGGYIAFGRDLFGKDIEKDTDEYRTLKGVILGTHYGAEAWTIATQLDQMGVRLAKRWERHVERAGELREKYLNAVPGVKRYMRERKVEAFRTQQVVGILGRVRHLPHSYTTVPRRGTPEWKHWKHIANEAINFPIQWAAACVTGAALIDVERELASLQGYSLMDWHAALLRREWPGSLLINEVHDALVLDLRPGNAKLIEELVIETMRAVPTLRRLLPEFDLKLDVDPKVAPVWGG